jgi:hypothetical protein
MKGLHYDYYTENLADFGFREICMLRDTLDAWVQHGLPDEFYSEGIRPAMNTSSGYVFLVNEEYQVAMLSDNKLEIYHTLPYSGKEGFIADLIDENSPDDLNGEDIEYILNAADISHTTLQPPWSDLPNSPQP